MLGATGDLSRRHLLPALAHLARARPASDRLALIGVGRAPMSAEAFRALVARSLDASAMLVGPEVRRRIVDEARYVQSDLHDPASLTGALAGAPVIAYLALPPWAFEPGLRCLRSAGIDEDSRVVVEKPFGQDRSSAAALNQLARTVVEERNVYRVDHFLHHRTTRNILDLRFAVGAFEPWWHAGEIERVEIRWDETAGVRGRGAYYDRTGALRDMVQSHLLALLSVVAMERADAAADDAIRAERVAVLRAIPSLTREDVRTNTVRGRYTAGRAGRAGDQSIGGYHDEPGVDPGRSTETFAAVRLSIGLPRWDGVPFLLRTGKALAHDRRTIDVLFRSPGPGVAGSGSGPAAIRFQMSPDIVLVDNGDGRGFVEMGGFGAPAPEALPASARLIQAVLQGDQTPFLRADEPEEGWRIVEPILEAWGDGIAPLLEYRAGTDGPPDAVLGGAPRPPLA